MSISHDRHTNKTNTIYMFERLNKYGANSKYIQILATLEKS